MKTQVVPFICRKPRTLRGTNIIAGQTLYAIRANHPQRFLSLYFIWSYSNRAFAEHIATKVWPKNATDVSWNWRHSVHDTIPTDACGRKRKKTSIDLSGIKLT